MGVIKAQVVRVLQGAQEAGLGLAENPVVNHVIELARAHPGHQALVFYALDHFLVRQAALVGAGDIRGVGEVETITKSLVAGARAHALQARGRELRRRSLEQALGGSANGPGQGSKASGLSLLGGHGGAKQSRADGGRAEASHEVRGIDLVGVEGGVG